MVVVDRRTVIGVVATLEERAPRIRVTKLGVRRELGFDLALELTRLASQLVPRHELEVLVEPRRGRRS